MNLVDLGIVVLVLLAAFHGFTQGAALQVFSFGGFWGGLWVGALLAPVVSGLAGSPFAKSFVSLFVVFGIATALGAFGRVLGTRLWTTLRRLRLGAADATLGGAVAIGASLVAVWLVALMLSAGPTRQLSAALHESTIVRVLVNRLPPAPTVFARIQALFSATPFPQVFQGLEPLPQTPVELPADPVVRAAVEAAGAATVRVTGVGCGGIQTGSGFVVGEGLVMTNAHVVSGIDRPVVEDASGRHAATAVVFDPNIDVAVLRTSGLAAGPLPLDAAGAGRGTGGAILGFPGGGAFTAGPGAVIRRFEALGRDIYGRELSRRDVYQVQGQVRQGNSGGPFVLPSGRVVGVIFAASTTDGGVGYALTSPQVAPKLDEARARSGAVDTGPCAN